MSSASINVCRLLCMSDKWSKRVPSYFFVFILLFISSKQVRVAFARLFLELLMDLSAKGDF
jgi:hypothetical protein